MSNVSDCVSAILACQRRGNIPHPNHPGQRIVGWIVDEDVAGLSDGLFAVEEIQRRALRDPAPAASTRDELARKIQRVSERTQRYAMTLDVELQIADEVIGDAERLLGKMDVVQAYADAAYIASVHAHHALWAGLLEYGWDEKTEAFGKALADRISKEIAAKAKKIGLGEVPRTAASTAGPVADDSDNMVKISKLIEDMQSIKDRFGDTCVYIRSGGLSWGAVALNRRDDDKKYGVFDLQAQHDRDMLQRLEQIERLKESRNRAEMEANSLRTALADTRHDRGSEAR